MELLMADNISTKSLAEKLNVTPARIREYAAKYENFTGRLVRGANAGDLEFQMVDVIIISEAHHEAKKFGSFARALEHVFEARYNRPPVKETAELSHVALEIRAEGLRNLEMMQKLLDRNNGRLEILTAAIELDRRQLAQSMNDVLTALQHLRSSVATQRAFVGELQPLTEALRQDVAATNRSRNRLVAAKNPLPVNFFGVQMSIDSALAIAYLCTMVFPLSLMLLIRLVFFP
jgi:hypothetical protein